MRQGLALALQVRLAQALALPLPLLLDLGQLHHLLLDLDHRHHRLVLLGLGQPVQPLLAQAQVLLHLHDLGPQRLHLVSQCLAHHQ